MAKNACPLGHVARDNLQRRNVTSARESSGKISHFASHPKQVRRANYGALSKATRRRKCDGSQGHVGYFAPLPGRICDIEQREGFMHGQAPGRGQPCRSELSE